jgi:hypothetical protein
MRGVLVAVVAALAVLPLVRPARAQPAGGGNAIEIDGLKLGMSPEQAEAALAAHDPTTRIREISAAAPSGQPAIRFLDAAAGGTEPGASAQQVILIFTLQPPARAYEIVRGRSFSPAERPTLEAARAAMLHAHGEPSWPDDFAGSIGMPGAHAYAYVFDRDGHRIDANTPGARDLYTACGGHGESSGRDATATQLAGRRETSVSDLLHIATGFKAACGVSYRDQFVVTPERNVVFTFEELVSDQMALADQDWVRAQAHDASAPPAPASAQAAPAAAAAQCQAAPPFDADLKRRQVAAASGDATAARELGRMYADGHGAPQDFVAALAWYTRAAVFGDPAAMFDVALMYDDGRGVAVDRGEAARWYQLAASHGHGRAEYNLALLYLRGDGVGRDPAHAGELFRAAAKDGVEVPPQLLSLGTKPGEPAPPRAATPPAAPAQPAPTPAAPSPAAPGPAAAVLPAISEPPAPPPVATAAAARPADKPLAPVADESCGQVLMAEQLEEEITNADRTTLHDCRPGH